MSLRKRIGWDELEREAGIARTEAPRPTQNDAERLERKILGPSWKKRRRKYRAR